jgi:hypothetical protein
MVGGVSEVLLCAWCGRGMQSASGLSECSRASEQSFVDSRLTDACVSLLRGRRADQDREEAWIEQEGAEGKYPKEAVS